MSRKLATLQAYLSDDQEIKTIVQLCSLSETSSWKQWISPYGSVFQVSPLKKIRIGNQTKNQSTDIFQNRSIADITRTSKLVVLFQEYLGLWGDDDRIRVFVHNDAWHRVCPLQLGLPVLRKVVRFEQDELEYQEINEGFISVLPVEEKKDSWKPNLAFLMPDTSNS